MFKKFRNARHKRKLQPKKSIASILDSHHKQKKTPPLFKSKQKNKEKLKNKKANTKLFKIKNSIKKMEKTRKALQFAISFAIMLAIFYLLFLSPIFQIQNIQVFQVVSQPDPENPELTIQTQEPFENQQLQNLLNRSIQRNIILLNTQSLKTTLNESIINLKNLEIQKKLPNQLIIEFKQFDRVANLVNLVGPGKIQKDFLIDENGKAVNPGEQRSDLPTIRIQTDEPFQNNKTALKPEKLQYSLLAHQYFEDQFDLQIADLTYLIEARELHIYTTNQQTIWLDTQQSYEDQLNKLKTAIPKLDIYETPLQYIDLRIKSATGQKIIYKPA